MSFSGNTGLRQELLAARAQAIQSARMVARETPLAILRVQSSINEAGTATLARGILVFGRRDASLICASIRSQLVVPSRGVGTIDDLRWTWEEKRAAVVIIDGSHPDALEAYSILPRIVRVIMVGYSDGVSDLRAAHLPPDAPITSIIRMCEFGLNGIPEKTI